MARMIQIRNVPELVHRILKVRAARAGKSLSNYLRGELERAAHQLTLEELEERLARAGEVALRESPAAAVRAERGPR
jgi:plasmid stability protein